jgi:hypothetical protein
MHARRLACFLLGIWLGAGLLIIFVTSQNLKHVDRVLAEASPAARLDMKAMGPNVRNLLRYQAAEQNRWYFSNWTMLQIGIGAAFFMVMLFGSGESAFVLIVIVIMTALAALQRFLILPEGALLGRLLDFLPADQGGPERARYWVIQTAYYGVEAAKWVAGLILAGAMVFSRRRSGRSRDSRREFDVVDKANYRGIDR